MAAGWVKLHRKLREWSWYQDDKTKGVFIELLLLASHAEKQWQGRAIKRGQVVTSLPSLAKSLGYTIRNVRTALDHLMDTGEISQEVEKNYRVVTVNNYAIYQAEGADLEDEATDDRQTNRQPKRKQSDRQKPLHNAANIENAANKTTDKTTDKSTASKEDKEVLRNSLSLIEAEAFSWLGGPMPPMMQSDITDLLTEGRADEELILEAIKIAKSKGKRSWPYAHGVLKGMIGEGFTTGKAYRESKMPKPGNGTEGKSSERGVNAGGRYREQVDWEKQFRTAEDMEG